MISIIALQIQLPVLIMTKIAIGMEPVKFTIPTITYTVLSTKMNLTVSYIVLKNRVVYCVTSSRNHKIKGIQLGDTYYL